MAHGWIASIEVWDHGVWDPTDPGACAAVVAKVQEARIPTDMRPTVRRVWWREDADSESPYLDVEISGERVCLNPGDHLVAVVLPCGDVVWDGLREEQLAQLRPPS